MAIARVRVSIGRKRIDLRVNGYERSADTDVKRWTKDVRKMLGSFVAGLEGISGEILVEALRPTFDESQILVPVKTGALKASGFLKTGKFRGVTTAEIGYGAGGDPFYATKVHEDLDVFHKPPTQAKFLEQPLRANINNIKNSVVFQLKEAING